MSESEEGLRRSPRRRDETDRVARNIESLSEFAARELSATHEQLRA